MWTRLSSLKAAPLAISLSSSICLAKRSFSACNLTALRWRSEFKCFSPTAGPHPLPQSTHLRHRPHLDGTFCTTFSSHGAVKEV
jgi:hypothetical protein